VQWEIFRQNTIDPEAIYIAEELTRHFRRYEDDVLVEPEQYVYNDLDAQLKEEEFQLRWGIKTINDARAERGMETIAGGDVPLIAQGFLPLNAAINAQPQQAPQQTARNIPSLPPAVPVVRRDVPYNTNEARAEFWRNYDGLTTENQIKLEDVTGSAIDELKKKIADKVKSGQTQIGGIQLDEKTTGEIQTAVNNAVRDIAQTVATQLEGNAVPLDGDYGKALQSLARESADKITESIDTIKSDVASVIQANAQKDKTELLNILTNRFDTIYSQSRLRTIANTVSANVTAGSQLATYKRLGYTYIWLTEQDNRVRPSHQIMEGKEVDADGFFSVPVVKKGITDEGAVGEIIVGYEKTERPLGGGLSASGAVNCRCQLFPVQRQKTETVNVNRPLAQGGRGSNFETVRNFEKNYRDLTTHEMALVTDKNGNILFENKGEYDEVKFSREQRAAIFDNGNAIMTHNHPKVASLSGPDMGFMILHDVAEIRAVDKKYLYVAERVDSFVGKIKNQDDLDFMLSAWESKMDSFAKRKMAADDMLGKEITNEYLDEINEHATHKATEWFANKYGIKYERIPHE
jgi:hypothetical protein